MFDLFLHFLLLRLSSLGQFFDALEEIYESDDRPEARRITVGCGVLMALFVPGIILLLKWS